MIGRASELLDYAARRRTIEVFGMFGCDNLGDEAMLTAAKAAFAPTRVVGTIRRTKYSGVNAILDARTPDVLVVGGGTLIHGGENGRNDWLNFVEAQMERGAEIATIGTGVSLTPDQIEKRGPIVDRWIDVLKRASMVGVRGPLTQGTLRRLGIESTIVGDLAFSLAEELPCDGQGDTIGINIGECLGDQHAYEQEMARIVRQLGKDHALSFYVVTPPDRESTWRVIEGSGVTGYQVWEMFHSVAQFMSKVRNDRMFLGVKLHASGLALCAGVPALLFEYKPKCRDFMAAISNEEALLSLPVAPDENDSKISKLLHDRSSLPDDVAQRVRKYGTLQREWAGRIVEIVRSR